RTRGYKVHVPPGYDPSKATPVLYSFHGLQQNAVMFTVDGTSLVAESDAEGFVLVMPNGVQEDGIGGSWNAGVCCGAAASAKLDEVGFVRAIHAAIREHLNIDPKRVYATGLSNGAFMAHRLGCEAADLFAAIAPLAGSIGTSELGAIGTNRDPDLKACEPSRPLPVLAMHGSGDGIVPYAGMKPSLDHWAQVAGCGTGTIAATQPASGGDTSCVTYRDCPQGIEITGCTVANGGHCWFGDESCGTGFAGIGNLVVGRNSDFLDASKAAWEFVSRFHM
ncbi:MAG TPA: PHB depolymerase family esterase, partial [Polyangiales bacterium]